MMKQIRGTAGLLAMLLAGCGGDGPAPATTARTVDTGQRTLTVRDTTITATFESAGVAEPFERDHLHAPEARRVGRSDPPAKPTD